LFFELWNFRTSALVICKQGRGTIKICSTFRLKTDILIFQDLTLHISVTLGYFAAGNTVEKIIQEFPDLNREQISACLDFARDLSEFEAVAV
jgi:uncharacterized protein (DUF433 family)